MTTEEMIRDMTAGAFFVNVEENKLGWWSAELIEQDKIHDDSNDGQMRYVTVFPRLVGDGASLALAIEDLYAGWRDLYAKRTI